MARQTEECPSVRGAPKVSFSASRISDRDGDGAMLGGVLIYAAAFVLLILEVWHFV